MQGLCSGNLPSPRQENVASSGDRKLVTRPRFTQDFYARGNAPVHGLNAISYQDGNRSQKDTM